MRKTGRKTMAAAGALFSLFGLFVFGGAAYSFLDRHDFYNSALRTRRCRRHLELIAAAKARLATDLSLTNGAAVAPEQIAEIVDGGWRMLSCPAGGVYDLRPVGQLPVCSVHRAP